MEVNKKIRIIYNPIHYVLDKDNSGSEISWSYWMYFYFTNDYAIKPFFLTGGVREISETNVINVQVFSPEKLNLSMLKIFEFYFKIFFSGYKTLKKERFDILHHVLPFYIGHSFNLLPFFFRLPFVLGPIQGSLFVKDSDLDAKDARGFAKKKRGVMGVLEKVIITLITPLISFLSSATVKRADKIIVVNNDVKKLLIDQNIESKKIIVIPPGINTSLFPKMKRDYNTPIIHILAVCLLLERKGVDLVLRAIGEVAKTNKDFHLHIIGDGPQKESLIQLAKKLRIMEHITFHGFIPQSNISTMYAKASLFVMMSRSEGFATVSLEAMASGLAIISTRVGGFKDVVKDNRNGYLVNQEDYRSLAEKIIYLLNHRNILAKMGKNARYDAEIKYDWGNVIIPSYVSVYKDIMVHKKDG